MVTGQVQEILINCASIITSGGVVCAFALKVGRKILNKELEPFNDRIDEMDKKREEQFIQTNEEIKIVKEELHKNSLNTMKNTICNDNIPLSERVSVGRDYIEKGGNGAVKILVHKLEIDYENELEKGR